MYVHVCGFRYYQIRFYIYMCIYMYVDFDIIKFVSTYICLCTYMWISILSNLFLHIYVYLHECGIRYYHIGFHSYISMYMYVDFDIIKFVSTNICGCTCMWISILSNFVTLDICVCTYMLISILSILFLHIHCICVCTCMWISIISY